MTCVKREIFSTKQERNILEDRKTMKEERLG